MGTILSRELTDFMSRFIELHKFGLMIAVFTFEGVRTIMQLGIQFGLTILKWFLVVLEMLLVL